MKSRTKEEIAPACGMCTRTLRRWFAMHRAELRALGVSKYAKRLPPRAVEFVCNQLVIDEEDFETCGMYTRSH